MPITRETLDLVAAVRRAVGDIADGTVRALTAAWVRAWDEIAAEVVAAIGELLSAGDSWPSKREIERSRRAMTALDLAARALERLAALAGQLISRAAEDAARATYTAQPSLIASQLPPGSRRQLVVRFGRADQDAVAAIVTRTTQQVTVRTWPLSRDATDAMRAELIRGVALGSNPREAGRRMVRRVEGAFNGGLARASTIARTEILDASRAAADASQADHADVLDGWIWNAALDGRVCPACLAMHGTLHPVSEPGPQGHPNCRCSRTPKTKSWADLGFDLPEPPSLLPDGREWFDGLPPEDRARIMGRRRLELLDTGAVDWADLPQKRPAPEWRDSYVARPVKDLEALAKRPA